MHRDVKWLKVADETADRIGLPRKVVRPIIRGMMAEIFRVMRNRRSRIILRKADIHTIYIEPGQTEKDAL